MVNLTYRAERALLGALLRDPDLLEDMRFLAADDFVSQAHREIFNAIRSVQASQTARTGHSYVLAVALAAPGPGPGVGYLEDSARACPQPANATAYARMVMEASLRRRLLAHANRFLKDAGDLHWEVGRFSQAMGSSHGTERFPSHLMKLAHAMWVHAKAFAPAPGGTGPQPDTGEPNEPVASGPRAAQSVSLPAISDADATLGEEDEVLADLIQHHWQNSAVLEWLPAEAFSPGARRQIYEAIVALTRNGDPVDELTVEWQMARHRAARQSMGVTEPNQAGQADGPRGIPGYVGVLAGLPVTDGTATLTGRTLLNRHTAAQLSAETLPIAESPGRGEPGRPPTGLSAGPVRGQERTRPSSHPNRPPVRPVPPPSFGFVSEPPTRPDLLEPPSRTQIQPTEHGPRPRP